VYMHTGLYVCLTEYRFVISDTTSILDTILIERTTNMSRTIQLKRYMYCHVLISILYVSLQRFIIKLIYWSYILLTKQWSNTPILTCSCTMYIQCIPKYRNDRIGKHRMPHLPTVPDTMNHKYTI